MYTVEKICDPLLPTVSRSEMKYEAVQHILRKGPEYKAGDQAYRKVNPWYPLRPVHDAVTGKCRGHRYPDNQHDSRMDVCKKFKKIRFKKANRRLVELDVFHVRAPY